MNTTMVIEGWLFDGVTPQPCEATLRVAPGSAERSAYGATVHFAPASLRASPRTGSADRFVLFPDGSEMQCRDGDALELLPPSVAAGRLVAWLEARAWVAALALLFTGALLALGYVEGLPSLAKFAARHVPEASERALGERALGWLDEQGVLRPSATEPDTQREILMRFRKLVGDRPGNLPMRVEFRDFLGGANAFALPGGILVLTDDMISAAESYDEVTAVLAHEAGHAEGRHALRTIVQGSVAALVVATVTGDAGSATLGSTVIPAVLLESAYSRDLEGEADAFAFGLLRRGGLSPVLLGNMLQRLGDQGDESITQFLSTHPAVDERVHAAREAAK